MEFHPELLGRPLFGMILLAGTGKSQEVLGNLTVALETKAHVEARERRLHVGQVMTKGELRGFLKLLGARQRQQGFSMDIMPVVEGKVEQQQEREGL